MRYLAFVLFFPAMVFGQTLKSLPADFYGLQGEIEAEFAEVIAAQERMQRVESQAYDFTTKLCDLLVWGHDPQVQREIQRQSQFNGTLNALSGREGGNVIFYKMLRDPKAREALKAWVYISLKGLQSTIYDGSSSTMGLTSVSNFSNTLVLTQNFQRAAKDCGARIGDPDVGQKLHQMVMGLEQTTSGTSTIAFLGFGAYKLGKYILTGPLPRLIQALGLPQWSMRVILGSLAVIAGSSIYQEILIYNQHQNFASEVAINPQIALLETEYESLDLYSIRRDRYVRFARDFYAWSGLADQGERPGENQKMDELEPLLVKDLQYFTEWESDLLEIKKYLEEELEKQGVSPQSVAQSVQGFQRGEKLSRVQVNQIQLFQFYDAVILAHKVLHSEGYLTSRL